MNSIPPREKAFSLTAAVHNLDVTAQWVSCIAAQENFRLSINDGPDFTFFQGGLISLPSAEIRKLTISQASGAAFNPNAIVILYGVGHFVDARLALQTGAIIQGSSASTLSGAAPDVALGPAINTQILAANAARRCTRIRNTHATLAVRLSSVAADLTAGRGELLNPGEILETFVTGEIYARSTGAATMTISEEVY